MANNRRPFAKLKGKPHFTSAANISFRFNPVDEELEEISLGEKEEVSFAVSDKKNERNGETSGENAKEHSDDFVKDDVKENKEDKSFEEKQSQSTINKDLPAKESVKDYLSKFSRRTCSLDSDYDPSIETEGWPSFKDITGKITKNIEECISKDIKGLITEDDVTEGVPFSKDTKQMSSSNISESSSLSASTISNESHISPSEEVTEQLGEDVTSYLTKDSAEKILFDVNTTGETSNLKNYHSKAKISSSSSSFNMTLSSLMANRYPSFEEDEKKSSPANKESKPTAVIKDTSVSSLVCEDAAKPKKPEALPSLFTQFYAHYYFIISSWNKVMTYILVVIVACLLAPLPSWFSGFLIGVTLSSCFTYWLIKPTSERKPFCLPDYENLPKLKIETSDTDKEGVLYKGWMNQLLLEYNPDTYHVNCTYSVYLRLDSSYLRISYPKTNIPKRAMFNEVRPELGFIHQQLYEIPRLMSVELLPENLSEKRLWIKKYPICLIFSNIESPIHKVNPSKVQSPKDALSKKYQPVVNKNGDIVLYLFARTDREKDDWYRRFLKVSKTKLLKSHPPSSTPNIVGLENDSLEGKRAISVDLGSLHMSSSFGNISSIEGFDSDDDDPFTELKFDKQLSFEYYMTSLLSPLPAGSPVFRKSIKDKTDLLDTKAGSGNQNTNVHSLLWINAIIGRAFFDFLKEEFWANKVSERIQRKLSKIKLPNFIDELKVTGIELGSSLPRIHRASDPVVDQRGLWVDLDVSYNGSFQMTLETKLNLTKLRKSDDDFIGSDYRDRELEDIIIRSRVYDNDEDDTAESSSDDDVPIPVLNISLDESTTAAGGSKGKKLFRIVDKIAQSSYFQSAAKNKYVKRAIEGVSKTPLALTVQIKWLTGTLALNFPQIPANRLWYGFRKNPDLSIVARPKLGCHAVKFAQIHEWIEKKLVLEFQKVLVMPNMDDLIIPIMQSESDVTKS